MTDRQDQIWAAEGRCFDEVAATTEFTTIEPATLRRFSSPHLRRAFYQEYMLRAAGELAGKRVLDLGCGRGEDAILLAKLGAHVTGLDVSAASVEFVRRRAEAAGVKENTSFLCCPVETAPVAENSFDLIWCHNILHHLTSSLDLVLARMNAWSRPGGRLVLTEPVALSKFLEQLRQALPARAMASSGEDTWSEHEQPLGWEELAAIRRRYPALTLRFFALFGRLERFVLAGHRYESARRARKAAAWMLVQADYPLLSLPYLKHLGRRVVMHGILKPVEHTSPGTERLPCC